MDPELDEEGAGCQSAEGVGQDPQRNECTGEEAADDDSKSPAKDLADPAHQKSASDGPAIPDDSRDAGLMSTETLGVCVELVSA